MTPTAPTRPPAGQRSPHHNLGEWPSHWARVTPDAPALADETRSVTWREFADRVARLAGWLRDGHIAPGDRVALLLDNRTEFLELFFATARTGAITFPINLRLTPREIAFQLDDCRPAAIFYEAALRPTLEEALALASHRPALGFAMDRAGDPLGEACAEASPLEEAVAVQADTPAILMYTSGTTGHPKGALLPHRKALYNALNAVEAFGIRPGDRVLVVAPLFHSLGLQILAIPLLYSGGLLVLHRRFDPEAVWKAVARERINYFGGVPAMHQRLYERLAASPPASLPDLRFVFSAGSAISTELIRNFASAGILVLQGYGQTETSTLTSLTLEDAPTRAGSVGRPVLHAELRVIRTETVARPPMEWEDAREHETGEIVVRGPITMVGYWERPEATAETLTEGWLRTGDLAQQDAEGFLTLVGRAREMLISGGENVYPAEIEAVYREHPAIQEIAVIGVPDPQWGEVPRAHILLEPNRDLDSQELESWGRERLAAFKIPRKIIIENDLPRTASGKVRKHKLRNPA
ncbi:MAG: AMP-binding protein [Myxococcota bacterium]|nr:AMP-binding protein [Myxococcota bacterium]